MPIDERLIASHPEADEHPAYVKFFNEIRGYGFIEVEGYDQDIFVHSRVIEQNGLSTIYDNQRLLVTVELGEKGYQIKTIRLLVTDNDEVKQMIFRLEHRQINIHLKMLYPVNPSRNNQMKNTQIKKKAMMSSPRIKCS